MMRGVWVGRLVVTGAAVLLVVLIGVTTRYVPLGTEVASGNGTGQGLDPKAWAQANYASGVVPAIEQKAQPWPGLIAAITADAQAAGQKYGVLPQGANSYSYAVTITGTLAQGEFGELAIAADGTPADVTVGFQVGPAVTGSALRDASGLLTFDMFTNQTDFQQAGVQINDLVKSQVLAGFDPPSAVGGKYTIVGAFTWTGTGHVTITPISVKAA
ncbi:MAG: DUF2291 domain-containing protein [Propionibacteriaceae bacterium]|jgi:predicted lipoprotein|nr:DUF2291 domain-containing protein [Propionibacteriaceae bacterium]